MGVVIKGLDAHVFCDDCGKDITVVNVYGMFCEDMCGYEDSIQAFDQTNEMIEGILPRL